MHGCCCLVAKSCDSFVTPWSVACASSVHGTSQARILEWVAISSSRISSPPRNQTSVFCIGRQILYHSAAREAPLYVVVVVKLLNHAWLFGTPRTVIHQAPLSMGFSRPISLYMVCLSNSQENFVRWVLLLSTLERRAKWVAKRTSDLPKVTFREETAVSGANSCFLCHLRGEGVRRERIHLLLLESLWESHNFV